MSIKTFLHNIVSKDKVNPDGTPSDSKHPILDKIFKHKDSNDTEEDSHPLLDKFGSFMADSTQIVNESLGKVELPKITTNTNIGITSSTLMLILVGVFGVILLTKKIK